METSSTWWADSLCLIFFWNNISFPQTPMVYHHVPSFIIPKILWFYVDVPSFSHHVPCFFGAPFDASQRFSSAPAQAIHAIPGAHWIPTLDVRVHRSQHARDQYDFQRPPQMAIANGDGWWIMVKGEFNGHLEVSIPYFLPIFQAYFSGLFL